MRFCVCLGVYGNLVVHPVYCRLQEEAEINRRDQSDAIAYKDTKMKLVQHHKDNVIGKVSWDTEREYYFL